jgi:hypothetical protein
LSVFEQFWLFSILLHYFPFYPLPLLCLLALLECVHCFEISFEGQEWCLQLLSVAWRALRLECQNITHYCVFSFLAQVFAHFNASEWCQALFLRPNRRNIRNRGRQPHLIFQLSRITRWFISKMFVTIKK